MFIVGHKPLNTTVLFSGLMITDSDKPANRTLSECDIFGEIKPFKYKKIAKIMEKIYETDDGRYRYSEKDFIDELITTVSYQYLNIWTYTGEKYIKHRDSAEAYIQQKRIEKSLTIIIEDRIDDLFLHIYKKVNGNYQKFIFIIGYDGKIREDYIDGKYVKELIE